MGRLVLRCRAVSSEIRNAGLVLVLLRLCRSSQGQIDVKSQVHKRRPARLRPRSVRRRKTGPWNSTGFCLTGEVLVPDCLRGAGLRLAVRDREAKSFGIECG